MLRPSKSLAPQDRYRVSVTWLDTYQAWLDDRITTDTFVARLERRDPAGEMAELGSQIHDLIYEHGVTLNERHLDAIGVGVLGDVSIPLDADDKREIKYVDDMLHNRANLVGVIDALGDSEVKDWKFTTKPNGKSEVFAESWQWRSYLAMSGRERFRYAVFPVRSRKKHYCIDACAEYVFLTYPHIRDSVSLMLTGLVKTMDKLVAAGLLDVAKVAQHPLARCLRCHSSVTFQRSGPDGKEYVYSCAACAFTSAIQHARAARTIDQASTARARGITPADPDRAFIFADDD